MTYVTQNGVVLVISAVFGHGDAETFKLKGYGLAARSVAALYDTVLVLVGAPHGKHEIAKRFVDLGIPANHLKVSSSYFMTWILC